MTNQTTSFRDGDVRSRMQGRGPVRQDRIEKAQDPRRALIRLARYLEPFHVILVMVLGFVLIYTVLGLMGPYLMGVAIDKFILANDQAGLIRIALLMLGAYLLNNLFQGISNWIMAKI
jgi:ATP-binding cassette subfamily B multidrug efflux pump